MSRFMSGEEGKTSRLWRVLSFEALGVLVYFCVLVYLCIITIILCNCVRVLSFEALLYLCTSVLVVSTIIMHICLCNCPWRHCKLPHTV